MSPETIQTSQTTNLKTNWVKQTYFYVVIALALLFLCTSVFTFAKASLVKFIFPKADNNFM